MNVPRNVTTAVGQTAFLHCRVHQLGDKEVSWMRKRDMHILSAGILMYTSDLRFQVIHPDKSENWTLQIKSPQERDSGVYECQVSTEPKMSLNYSLNVVGEITINLSRELSQRYQDHTRIYTDGSETQNSIGYSIVFEH
ncbi:hypothetical protein QLX08_005329 [Tetragonisca angustula]|uniref:Ig-like domain-containing protein n=1 Tax=Tetragonisca angustula TaxID=166442 RepID=A0AAW1A1L4_9HYME